MGTYLRCCSPLVVVGTIAVSVTVTMGVASVDANLWGLDCGGVHVSVAGVDGGLGGVSDAVGVRSVDVVVGLGSSNGEVGVGTVSLGVSVRSVHVSLRSLPCLLDVRSVVVVLRSVGGTLSALEVESRSLPGKVWSVLGDVRSNELVANNGASGVDGTGVGVSLEAGSVDSEVSVRSVNTEVRGWSLDTSVNVGLAVAIGSHVDAHVCSVGGNLVTSVEANLVATVSTVGSAVTVMVVAISVSMTMAGETVMAMRLVMSMGGVTVGVIVMIISVTGVVVAEAVLAKTLESVHAVSNTVRSVWSLHGEVGSLHLEVLSHVVAVTSVGKSMTSVGETMSVMSVSVVRLVAVTMGGVTVVRVMRLMAVTVGGVTVMRLVTVTVMRIVRVVVTMAVVRRVTVVSVAVGFVETVMSMGETMSSMSVTVTVVAVSSMSMSVVGGRDVSNTVADLSVA